MKLDLQISIIAESDDDPNIEENFFDASIGPNNIQAFAEYVGGDAFSASLQQKKDFVEQAYAESIVQNFNNLMLENELKKQRAAFVTKPSASVNDRRKK